MVVSIIGGCEEEIIPDDSLYKEQYVVEAYLEQSSESIPPYLFLTKSLNFYSRFDTNVLKNLFIHGAQVLVEVDSNQYKLEEICINQLPPDIKKEVLNLFGYSEDSIAVDFCAYVDINRLIPVITDKTYKLKVIIGSDTIYSKTTIPSLVRIDSFWFDRIPNNLNDSFAQLFCIIDDVPGRKDFYRNFTAGQNEILIPNFSSVTNDFFFDGQKFKFTLSKAQAPGEEFSDNTGYFRRGDTVRVKWCNIDEDHFNFWNTLEVSRTRQGPFSAYVRIDGNIENGLGIFGGQNCETYTLVVPKI